MGKTASTEEKGFHYGYVVVIASCMLLAAVSIALSCMGLFYTPMAEEFGVGVGMMSNYMTAMWLVAMITSALLGGVFDKVDARIIDTAAVLSIAAGIFICSIASSHYVVFAGGAVAGFGVATILYMSGPILVNRWFEKRTGVMLSIVTLFTAAGAIVFSPIFGNLMESIGWHATLTIAAVVALVLGLPASIFMVRSYPSDKGLKPYGAGEAKNGEGEEDAESQPGLEASRAFRTPTFVLLVLFAFVLNLAMYTQAMNPNYIKSLDISVAMPTLFSTIASVLMLGQAITKISVGATAEKHPLASGIVFLCVGIFGFVGNVVFSGSWIALCITGACIGAYTALTNVLNPILTRRFFGKRDYTRIYSILGVAMSISSLLQAPILGTLRDATSWECLEYTFAGLLVLCIVLLCATVKSSGKVRAMWEK